MPHLMTDPAAVPDYLDLLRLPGRAVVVLGAGAGMGRQSAHAVAQVGASVVCVDRDPDLAAQVAREVKGIAVAGDVTRRDEVERIVAEAERAAGPLWGLVDVIGAAFPGGFDEYGDEAWDRQIDIVLTHARLALQVGGGALRRNGGGAMVFVGSASGEAYAPNQAVYGVAKAALHHLVRSVGIEWAHDGVRVNLVAPGPVRTPRLEQAVDEAGWRTVGELVPRGHVGVPSEIASAVLFLLSDLASYVNGQVLLADGGSLNRMPTPRVDFYAPPVGAR